MENNETRKIVSNQVVGRKTVEDFAKVCIEAHTKLLFKHWQFVGKLNGHLLFEEAFGIIEEHRDKIVESIGGDGKLPEDITVNISTACSYKEIVPNLISYLKTFKVGVVNLAIVNQIDEFIGDLLRVNNKIMNAI